jgi:hypothetical protein
VVDRHPTTKSMYIVSAHWDLVRVNKLVDLLICKLDGCVWSRRVGSTSSGVLRTK